MRLHFGFTVSWIMAATGVPLHAASVTPSTQSSAAGLLLAGVVLIGIGRFRLRKR
jgi:hypothetical protein